MRLDEMEGFDEIVAKFVSTLTPEQRLAGLAPEQRLAGLAPTEAVLALPDALLRALSPEFVDALPAEVRARVRARIG